MRTPRSVVQDLCFRALCYRFVSSTLRPKGKPGEFLERFASPEERKILSDLKSEDLQNSIRPELFFVELK